MLKGTLFESIFDLCIWCFSFLLICPSCIFQASYCSSYCGQGLENAGLANPWTDEAATRRVQDNLLSLCLFANPKELWDIWVLTKQTNVYMVPKACTDPDTVLTCVVMQSVWLHQYSTRTTNRTHTTQKGDLTLGPCASIFSVCTFLVLKMVYYFLWLTHAHKYKYTHIPMVRHAWQCVALVLWSRKSIFRWTVGTHSKLIYTVRTTRLLLRLSFI